MMKYILVVLVFLLNSVIYGQYNERELKSLIENSSEKVLVNEATLLLTQGFYYQSERITDKLLTFDPNSSNYNYRKGFLVILTKSDYVQAIHYLEKAVTNINLEYDMSSPNEKKASLDALFHLATCYHTVERIEEAKKQYNEYINRSTKRAVLAAVSEMRLLQCEVALKAMQNPVSGVDVHNVGDKINSSNPEYSSIVALDGSALFFTSRRPWENDASLPYVDLRTNFHPEDIFVSYLDSMENWTDPIRLDFCTAEHNEATVAVNVDERKIYTYNDDSGNGDIYFTDLTDGKFAPAMYLDNQKINSKHWETHASFTEDGDLMYFVSDRPGGFGGRDIYVSKRENNGSWGNPKNLGPSVNTKYDEESPFISIDGKNLYFSSNGEESMGGFDIFVATKDATGNWTKSMNLGYPINSCGDDLYYSTTIDGYKGYFTSYRAEGKGEKDVYEVSNNYLGIQDKSYLKDKAQTADKSPLPANFAMTFTCLDCNEPHTKTIFPRLRDGVFINSFQPCHTYELAYHLGDTKNILFKDTVKTECDKRVSFISKSVVYNPIDQTVVAYVEPNSTSQDVQTDTLETVSVIDYKVFEMKYFFKYDDNKLSAKGKDFRKFRRSLEKQVKAVGKPITIRIYSSASTVPTIRYESNEQLAELRAENVKYDLITYFQQRSSVAHLINVVVVESAVNGPAYENDSKNIEKYRPFQYVILKTE